MAIIVKKGNLLHPDNLTDLDGIMNAANGIGPMGRGIAGAIRKIGGIQIQTDAFRICKEKDPQPGQAYSTISGDLEKYGIKRIIHAVTMKQPGGPTSYEIIKSAFQSAIELAIKEGITHLGCTALGTGVGGLKAEKVASEMIIVVGKFPGFNLSFIDIDSLFIQNMNLLDGQ